MKAASDFIYINCAGYVKSPTQFSQASSEKDHLQVLPQLPCLGFTIVPKAVRTAGYDSLVRL